MQRIFLFILLSFLALSLKGQGDLVKESRKLKPDKDFDNVLVQKLYADAKVSSYVIWIKKRVPLHKHALHSEHVYVLKGKGEMRLGEETRSIKKGDLVIIPEGTPHGVEVKGGTLKVLSFQAPEFKGRDRIKLE